MKKTGSLNAAALMMASAALALSACGGDDADPPVAVKATADSATISWNAPVDIDVLANDSASRGTLTLTTLSAPAHGTATIASGKVRYTPAAGYLGADRLTYTVTGVDGSTATAPLGLSVEAVLTLSGVVSDGPIANAAITAAVGSRSVVTQADASGAYQLTVRSSDPTELVVLTATGTGTQSKVKLTSVAGDVAALATLAAEGGRLTAARLPALDVTHLSTSFVALVTEVNGGALPASKAAFDNLVGAVSLQRAVDLAAAIKLVADHGVALPAAFADTLALVAKPSASPALDAFLLAQTAGDYPTPLDTTRLEVLAASVPAGKPAIATAAAQTLVYYVADKLHAFGVLQVSYRPDGTARVTTQDGVRDATWTTAADGQVDVVLAQPFSVEVYSAEPDPVTGEQYPLRNDTTGYSFRQVAGTSTRGAVLMLTAGAAVSLSGSTSGTVVPFDTSTGTLQKVQDITAAPAGALALTAGDFTSGTVWAGVVPQPGPQAPQDLLSIVDGARARYVHSNAAVAWSVADGALSLVDGAKQIDYRRLTAATATGEEHWLVTNYVDGTAASVNELLVAKATPGLRISADASLFRRWISGVVDTLILALNADGSGGLLTVSADDSQGTPFDSLDWVVDADGSLTMTRSNGFQRIWQALRQQGGSIIVMERYGNDFADAVQGWRVNIYTDGGPAAQ